MVINGGREHHWAKPYIQISVSLRRQVGVMVLSNMSPLQCSIAIDEPQGLPKALKARDGKQLGKLLRNHL